MADDGVWTSFAAFMTTTAAINLTGILSSSITVQAQLWTAAPGSNIFFPVPSAIVTFSPIVGTIVIAPGVVRNGRVSFAPVPYVAETRYMTVFSATATGLVLVNVVSGYMEAGAGL